MGFQSQPRPIPRSKRRLAGQNIWLALDSISSRPSCSDSSKHGGLTEQTTPARRRHHLWRRTTWETAAPCAASSGLEPRPPAVQQFMAASPIQPPHAAPAIRSQHRLRLQSRPHQEWRRSLRNSFRAAVRHVPAAAAYSLPGIPGGGWRPCRGLPRRYASCKRPQAGAITLSEHQRFSGHVGAQYVCGSAADCIDTAALLWWAAASCVTASRRWQVRPEAYVTGQL